MRAVIFIFQAKMKVVLFFLLFIIYLAQMILAAPDPFLFISFGGREGGGFGRGFGGYGGYGGFGREGGGWYGRR